MTDPDPKAGDPPDPKPDDPKKSDPDPKPDPTVDDFDKDRALATIRAQRDSENKLKAEVKELREAKAKLDKIEADQLSEKERLEKQVSDLEGKVGTADVELREARLLRAVISSKVKVADADVAATLLKDRIEYEDGKPQNVDDALTALLEEKPILKGKLPAPSVDGGEGGGAAERPNLTAEQAQMAQMFGLKPEEYAAWSNKQSATEMAERELEKQKK